MVTRRQVCASLVGVAVLSGCGRPTELAPGDDPTTIGTWTKITDGPLSARHGAIGGWLAGRFVIAGGESTLPCPPGAQCLPPNVPALRDGAAFDPSTGRWTPLPDAPTPITTSSQSVVVGDRLYVLTSDIGQPDSPDAFLCYDAGRGRNSWATLPLPTLTQVELIGTGPAGVIAMGSSDEQRPALDFRFDPELEKWIRLPDDPLGPSYGREGAWLDDRLLLATRGTVGKPRPERPALIRLASWDPVTDRWTEGPDTELIGGTPIWVGRRVVWPSIGSYDGGPKHDWGRSYAYGGIFDSVTDQWTALPSPPKGRGLGGLMQKMGNKVAVGGHLLDPVTLAWTIIPDLPTIDQNVPAVVIAGDGAILAWGGADAETNLADGYLLRLS